MISVFTAVQLALPEVHKVSAYSVGWFSGMISCTVAISLHQIPMVGPEPVRRTMISATLLLSVPLKDSSESSSDRGPLLLRRFFSFGWIVVALESWGGTYCSLLDEDYAFWLALKYFGRVTIGSDYVLRPFVFGSSLLQSSAAESLSTTRNKGDLYKNTK